MEGGFNFGATTLQEDLLALVFSLIASAAFEAVSAVLQAAPRVLIQRLCYHVGMVPNLFDMDRTLFLLSILVAGSLGCDVRPHGEISCTEAATYMGAWMALVHEVQRIHEERRARAEAPPPDDEFAAFDEDEPEEGPPLMANWRQIDLRDITATTAAFASRVEGTSTEVLKKIRESARCVGGGAVP